LTAKVFIDGEAGTTGLQIRERLAGRRDIALIQIDPARRKDAGARADALNEADVAILCLPDDAAREAAALVTNPNTKIVDPSTAHRVAPGWAYGFPEAGFRDAIRQSARVSNPGCYSTGAIALLKPLVAAGIVPATWPVTINAVSGYSGGGKAMIAEFEDKASPDYTNVPYRIYALTLAHKHVPEIQRHAGLIHPPLFAPAVGRYAQGMIVEVPLPLWALRGAATPARVHAALADAYAGERFVSVRSLADAAALKTLAPEGLNNTNRMELYVFANADKNEARLVALLDNLGKGASGAAVQNMNLLLGVDEGEGL
jgi:N-acetyl-gamma-glutamyl-phosphate reductase